MNHIICWNYQSNHHHTTIIIIIIIIIITTTTIFTSFGSVCSTLLIVTLILACLCSSQAETKPVKLFKAATSKVVAKGLVSHPPGLLPQHIGIFKRQKIIGKKEGPNTQPILIVERTILVLHYILFPCMTYLQNPLDNRVLGITSVGKSHKVTWFLVMLPLPHGISLAVLANSYEVSKLC